MPPLPSPGAVIKANVNWTIEGDALGETIHFFSYTGGPPIAADLSSFASDVVLGGAGNFQALASNFVGMNAATLRDLSSSMGVEVTAGTPWVGTRGTELLSPGTAVVVSHSISRHYRGGHPRTYLPLGISSDIATTGLWASAFTTSVHTAWQAWINNLLGTTYGGFTVNKLVNVSYYGPPNRTITGSGGRVRTVSTVRGTPIVNDITSSEAKKNIGSQRRRNRDA